MVKSKQNFGLLLLAFLFIVLGLTITLNLLKDTFWSESCINGVKMFVDTEIISNSATKVCYCSKGKTVCEKKNALEVTNKELQVSDFVRNDLTFDAQYLANGINTDLDSLPLKTDMMSIKQGQKTLEIILRQGQLCSASNKVPIQIGLYNFTNGTLTLMNVVNAIESIYNQPCTVQLTYQIKNITLEQQKTFKLQFRSEDGEVVPAQICVYQGTIYNENDNYIAKDGCNICKCVNGISKCSNDRVCNK